MQVRGRARMPGTVKTCTITKKADGWHAAIVVETECKARAALDPGIAGMDWGIESFATLARCDGSIGVIANDRFLAAEAEALAEEARAFAREHPGRRRTRRLQRAGSARSPTGARIAPTSWPHASCAPMP
jgi:putative transposase